MKIRITCMLFSILCLSGHLYAQIASAVNGDNPFFTPNTMSNTGVAISPDNVNGGFDYTAVVADEVGSNAHLVGVYNNINQSLLGGLTFTGIGEDPDVAYGANPDLFFVVSEDIWNQDILLEEYYFNPPSYSPGGPVSISGSLTGCTYPNIDMNAQWEGVVVFEDGNQHIYAVAVSFGFVGPPVFIERGTMPDVAVHDHIGEFSITFIDTNGDLQVYANGSYQDLVNGSYSLGGTYAFSTLTSGPFNAPRIATQHNEVFPAVNETFTVVVSDSDGADNLIRGFFFDGFSMNDVIINQTNIPPSTFFNTLTCFNDFPVVAYRVDGISVAWSWERDPSICNLTGGNTGAGKVLVEGLDVNGQVINNFTYGTTTYQEANNNVGNFQHSKSAITAQYDGEYGVPPNHYNESIVFHNGVNVYWKNQSSVNIPSYKPVSESENSENLIAISFSNDMDNQRIEVLVEGNREKRISMYDVLGRRVLFHELREQESSYSIDYAHLSSGSYFVSIECGTEFQTYGISK